MQSHQFDLRIHRDTHFLHQLFMWPDVADHFVLKHLPHCLFDLLEEDLGNPTTERVDRVQELGLDGVEERLEHVVLKGKLQRRRHQPMSVSNPKFCAFVRFFFLFDLEHITG